MHYLQSVQVQVFSQHLPRVKQVQLEMGLQMTP